MRYLPNLLLITICLLYAGCESEREFACDSQSAADAAVAASYAHFAGGEALPTPAPDPKPNPYFDYNQALRKYSDEQRPMLVILGSRKCGPCQRMKRELPAIRSSGLLDRVEVVEVEYESQRELADRVLKGEPVRFPYVALFWMRGGTAQSHRQTGYIDRRGYERLLQRIP